MKKKAKQSQMKSCEIQTRFMELHEAIGEGYVDEVTYAIADGADVNAKDDLEGLTPLHRAIWYGHKKIVKLLIDAGANVNLKADDGSTPLHHAAYRVIENMKLIHEIVEKLISADADVNVKDDDGETPLDVAITKQTKIADLLRKHGGKTSEELKAEGK